MPDKWRYRALNKFPTSPLGAVSGVNAGAHCAAFLVVTLFAEKEKTANSALIRSLHFGAKLVGKPEDCP